MLMTWMCVVCLLSTLRATAQEDSIRYEPGTEHYLLYRRDSVGQWTLREIWDRGTYLDYRARRMGLTPYTMGGARKSVMPQRPPQLSLTANGSISLSLSETRIEDDNPALNSMMRRRSFVDVVQQTNVNLLAKYGERLHLDL